MKKVGWLVLFVAILVVTAIFAYRGGYTVGSDMAERDNRTEAP
ncbi:MAG: hypothetical protein ACO1OD_00960 [Croceibacterium sp.]